MLKVFIAVKGTSEIRSTVSATGIEKTIDCVKQMQH
jgi:hypothetical protein